MVWEEAVSISQCDNCGQTRPGLPGEVYGIEGFFCHICRGDELDPYGELEDSKVPPCNQEQNTIQYGCK